MDLALVVNLQSLIDTAFILVNQRYFSFENKLTLHNIFKPNNINSNNNNKLRYPNVIKTTIQISLYYREGIKDL